MTTIVLILLVIAAVAFVVEAVWHRSLLALGLLAWVLAILIPRL